MVFEILTRVVDFGVVNEIFARKVNFLCGLRNISS